MAKVFQYIFLGLIFWCAIVQAESIKPVTVRFPAMGTEFVFIIYPPSDGLMEEDIRNLCSPAIEAIQQLEKHISHYLTHNDVYRLNQSAGMGPVVVHRDVFEAIQLSKLYWERTGGAFDPTVGPLLELWGFYRKKNGQIPTKHEVQSVLTKVGMDKVKIHKENSAVELTVPGMRLDFGGIGKGMALDRAGRVLRAQGIRRGILHSGTSTVLALEPPPDAQGWKIAIRSPYNREEHIEQFTICNESLSTSSISEQYLQHNGKKYGHIFDPTTGMPVENRILSTTVIAQTATETDALSTAFFVMDTDKTIEYCKRFPKVKVFLVEEGENNSLKKEYINF